MKKIILSLSLAAIAVLLAGCGQTAKNAITAIDLTQSAKEIGQDSQSLSAVSSEENINNIMKFMNLQGLTTEQQEQLKGAIKEGIETGKVQGELNKDLIKTAAAQGTSLGTGYMLGYTFGCKAATGDENKCQQDLAAKYQPIIMEEFNKMAAPAQ